MFPYVCAICVDELWRASPRSNQNILCCKVRWLAPTGSGVGDEFELGVVHKKAASLSLLCFHLQHYFLIVFGHDGQKPLELRTEEESECDEWVEAIQQARYTQQRSDCTHMM